MKVVGIIPARYASTRLPGKPLKNIMGHPMVWWVYHRVCSVDKLDEIYVATDDERIRKVCDENRIPVIMTANTHSTGAHRLWEVSETVKADFYVQLNGDEPLIDTNAIKAVIPDKVPQETEYGTNVITEITDAAQALDPTNIKMVFNEEMEAVYMSRIPIPFPYKAIDFTYYKHVGIIGYNKKMLDFYQKTTPGRFERIEGIDTLRFIDYGKQLQLFYVPNCHSLSVDTQKDLDMVIEIMKEKDHGKK